MSDGNEYTGDESERRVGMQEVLRRIDILQNAIDKNKELTGQISQRQEEITLPKLTALDEFVNGNGHVGLKAEHAKCQERIKNLEETRSNTRNWIAGCIFAVAIAIIGAAVSYGRLEQKVSHLADAVTTRR